MELPDEVLNNILDEAVIKDGSVFTVDAFRSHLLREVVFDAMRKALSYGATNAQAPATHPAGSGSPSPEPAQPYRSCRVSAFPVWPEPLHEPMQRSSRAEGRDIET